MRSRIPLFLLLASSLVFLGSLFLPWHRSNTGGFFVPSIGAPDIFSLVSGGGAIDGWVGGVGDMAVLVGLATALTTVAALLRPRLATKLPLGGLGVGLAYFAAAAALQASATSGLLQSIQLYVGPREPPSGFHPHTSWAYGVYVGAAAGAVALLCGLAIRRRELVARRPASDYVAGAIGLGLLASFLLPWEWTWTGAGGLSEPGIGSPPAAFVALGLLLGAGRLLRSGDDWRRLSSAVAATVLSVAAGSAVPLSTSRAYGAWIGIGCAISLLAAEAVRARGQRLPATPSRWPALRAGAAFLLLVSLFLPWEELFERPGSTGWETYSGAAAGSLALLLIAALAVPALASYAFEIAVAIALLVAALGRLASLDGSGLAYGAYVGFGAAGLLVAATLVPFRPEAVDRRRALVRTVPLALCVACLGAIVVPWWAVMHETLTFKATALPDWLSLPALVLILYLTRAWVAAIRTPAAAGHTLTGLALFVLALPALELIRMRGVPLVDWAAVILVGLCLVLAALGWIEEHGGLESLRVSDEIWRVDRLPGES